MTLSFPTRRVSDLSLGHVARALRRALPPHVALLPGGVDGQLPGPPHPAVAAGAVAARGAGRLYRAALRHLRRGLIFASSRVNPDDRPPARSPQPPCPNQPTSRSPSSAVQACTGSKGSGTSKPTSRPRATVRSEENTSALQSLMRTSNAVFCM